MGIFEPAAKFEKKIALTSPFRQAEHEAKHYFILLKTKKLQWKFQMAQ